jgi:hypothetical protein
MKKKQINILDQDGKKINTASLLKLIGYDVYGEIKPPGYAAALVFDKCGFSQQEIIELITKNYPR